MAATGCSDEDTKAMLQLHNGDVNAATIALLENPFQKVDSAVHKQAAKPAVMAKTLLELLLLLMQKLSDARRRPLALADCTTGPPSTAY